MDRTDATADLGLSSAWGRWGEDDEAGALNLIGSDEVRAAAGLVRDGCVISLAQELGPRTPAPAHRKGLERYMTRDGGDYAAGARRPDGFQFAEEVVSFAPHVGTHLDALAHAWYDDRLYNGFPGAGVRSTTGAERCGAEKLRPIVTRGLLLDLAANRAELPGRGEAFGAAELEHACRAAGTAPEAGDAVLLRTGWLGRSGEDAGRYFEGEPGLDVSGAAWLASAGVAVVGADNYAVEVQPSAPGSTFPVHQLLMRDQGIPLIENLALDALAACRRSTFLFVAAPLPLVGCTAAPVCPVAVL